MELSPNASRGRARRILKWVERALWATGIVALSVWLSVKADAMLFQWRQERLLEQILAQQHVHAGSVRPGELLGRLEIPSVGVSSVVLEGDDEKTLRRAVGHISDTAFPGDPGNIALAGHRDSFFRGLRRIHVGDEIRLTTLNGVFVYRVLSTAIVEPSQVGVLEASTKPVLTLVTCYPFSYIGAAPKRFIVRAIETESHPRAGNRPPQHPPQRKMKRS